jgi:glycosyltransferase involved in cell wall biosynthesis
MRIAFFNWRDIRHPLAGGSEVYSHHILKRIAAMGHKVTVFSGCFRGGSFREIIDGVEHIRFGGKYSIYAKSYFCYKKHVEGKYDVIVESINGVPFFTPLFAKEPILAFIHQLTRQNWYSGLAFPLAFLGYHIEDYLLKPYTNLGAMVPSESTRSDLMALGFTDVNVIREGVEVKRPSRMTKNREPTMIYLGRLAKSKRVDHAILAFASLRKEIPGSKLWIAGSGPEEKSLKELSARLGLAENVVFFGKVDEGRKAELLSAAHLLLFPATREGWGLVVLEANACGTPVIGYDVHGLRDSIKNGMNGFIVEEGDHPALARKAASLLRNPEELKRLSISSIWYSRNFDNDKSAEEFISLLERKIDGKKAH